MASRRRLTDLSVSKDLAALGWKCTDERIVGSDFLPVDVGKGVVGQRLVDALLDEVGCLTHLAGPKILDDRSGLLVGGRSALLRMNGFEHVAHVADLCCL
jgi:hypothetical protein